MGRHSEALASFESAAACGARSPAFLFNLALTALKSSALNRAEVAFRELLSSHPDHIDGLINLAAVLKKLDRDQDAEPLLRRVLSLAPDNAVALGNLAILLRDRDELSEAMVHVEHALRLRPEFTDALTTKASILAAQHEIGGAIELYRRAVALEPQRAKALSALSVVLHESRAFAEAFDANAKAIALDPAQAEPHFNRAMYLFAQGRLAEGWIEYDWRWRTPGVPARWRSFPQPLWRGGPIGSGKKLLIWAEQGVGDEILYASLLPDLIQTHPGVVFECDPRLAPLFSRSFPSATIVRRSDPPDPVTLEANISAQAPAADLGRIFRPDLASFPKRQSFLTPDPAQVHNFMARLNFHGTVPVVGISWFSKNRGNERHKSSALRDWAPILTQAGCKFVDLQYDDTAADRHLVRQTFGVDVIHFDDIDLRQDLNQLAALITACDLVITVCNTTAHMAAALGKPVWVMTSHERGRLWWTFLDRADSPWYPTAKLFRQSREGDWHDPIAAIATQLASQLANRLANP